MFKRDLEGDLKGYLKGDLKGDFEVDFEVRLGGGFQRGLQTGLGRGHAVKLRSSKVQVRSRPGSVYSSNYSLELDSDDLSDLVDLQGKKIFVSQRCHKYGLVSEKKKKLLDFFGNRGLTIC